MRGVEQAAHLVELARRQRRHRVLDARVLGDHVPRPLAQRRGQLLDRVERRVAQAGHAELLTRASALRAALVVARSGVGVLLTRVERDQPVVAEVQRHRLHAQRAEVDSQRPVGLAEQRGDLVEQAGLGADPIVLDPRAGLGQVHPVGLGNAGQPDQGKGQADLERGRG